MTEPLFAALMRQLTVSPPTKTDGLASFKKMGWILVDATYEQVDKHSNSVRNDVIDRGYKELCNDLEILAPNRSVPLILIKANVCRKLKPRLAGGGYTVLNGETVVPFPSHGWQTKFRERFGEILKTAGLKVGC